MRKRGITLIELVIVMAIIAICALLIAPNIGAWIPNYRLRSGARDIVSALRTAQVKAVSTNREYRVFFNPGARTYIIQYQNSGWRDDGATQALPTGVQMTVTLPGNTASFKADSTSSAGAITLTGTKGSKTISLTGSVGRVTLK